MDMASGSFLFLLWSIFLPLKLLMGQYANMTDLDYGLDEIRKSIDILDQVLSEFDDIEPYLEDGVDFISSGDQEVPYHPPPIDRSLKPRQSPPILPQKQTKKSLVDSSSCVSDDKNDSVRVPSRHSNPNFSLSRRSHVSKVSEVSSHEYQEINTDFYPGESKESGHKQDEINVDHRAPSRCDLAHENDQKSPRKGSDPSLRRARSGDRSLNTGFDPYCDKRKRNGRSRENECERPTDRTTDHPYHVDPRRLSESGLPDRRILDPEFHQRKCVDPRFVDMPFEESRIQEQFCDPNLDPRFMDRRLFDPGLQDMNFYDPRFMDPGFIEAQMLMNETNGPFNVPRGGYPPGGYAPNDHLNFPHLLPSNSYPNYTLPHPAPMNYHPQALPPYQYPMVPGPMEPPLVNPDGFVDYPVHMNPQVLSNGMRHCGTYPVNYPLDMPLNYPMDIHPMHMNPRDRLSLDGGGRTFPLPRDPRFYPQDHWVQGSPGPRPNRPAMSRSRERIDYRGAENGQERYHQKIKRHMSEHHKSMNSDGSENTSPHQGMKTRHKSNPRIDKVGRSSREEDHRHFKVGDEVQVRKERKEFGGKDTVSAAHQSISGGKDSGFDENLHLDDGQIDVKTKGMNRGSFVVAGVFTDSSKMYIPAPPSPTPDYDKDRFDSGDEDADIPQEPFYVSSSGKKIEDKSSERKNSSDSKNSSVSEDSLQILETESKNKKKGQPENGLRNKSPDKNPLKTMIDKFHRGLPSSGYEEGGFSDDSLESSNASPSISRHKKANLSQQRPESLESLVSIDSSTASFDYVTEYPENKTSQAANENNTRHSRNSIRKNPAKDNRLVNSKSQSVVNETKANQKIKDIPKFGTVKNLMKEGLIEGLDEMPPDFMPPPPPTKSGKKSGSVDRADSGIGSNASTKCRKESSGSDEISENRPVPTQMKNNRDFVRRSSSPPPVPPPRDTSLGPNDNNNGKNVPSDNLSRNQSWLYKRKPDPPSKPKRIDDFDKRKSISCNEELQKKSRNLHDLKPKKYNSKADLNSNEERSPNVQKMNSKNIELNSSSKKQSKIITDDDMSVSSQGSKSKLFSRFSESIKSNRSNSPSNSKSKSKKSGSSQHADFIRVSHNTKKEAPLPPNIGYNTKKQGIPNGKPGFSDHPDHPIVSSARDGTGRFRSFENLTDSSPCGKSLEYKRPESKDTKRNTTLPFNSTSSEGIINRRHNAEQSTNKDESGSRFKFNVFKGLWRRSKYSFEKA